MIVFFWLRKNTYLEQIFKADPSTLLRCEKNMWSVVMRFCLFHKSGWTSQSWINSNQMGASLPYLTFCFWGFWDVPQLLSSTYIHLMTLYGACFLWMLWLPRGWCFPWSFNDFNGQHILCQEWFEWTLVDADVAINSFMWQNGGHSGPDHWEFEPCLQLCTFKSYKIHW